MSTHEVYDIATDSWSTKTTLPVIDYFIQAHVVDGEIFVVTKLALYVYDPVEDSWTKRTNTPTQEVHASSTVVDNKIIIVDKAPQGKDNDSYTVGVLKVTIYEPKTNVWSEGQTSPELYLTLDYPIVNGVTAGVYAPKKLYVIFPSSSIFFMIS